MKHETGGAISRLRVWLGGIVLAGVLLRIPLMFLPLTYGSDTWRQADTASIARHFLVNGFNIFYPQIFWGGSGPGYVETEFQIYPFLVSLLYAVFGEKVWLGRLVSLLFSVPTMLLMFAIARRRMSEAAALSALALFVFSPLYLRYSVAFMPEAAVLFFYVCALFLFDKWIEHQRIGTLWLCGLMTCMAILVKPTSVHIGLTMAVFAVSCRGWSVLKKVEIWAVAAGSLVPVVLWYIHARDLYLKYGNTFGLLSGGDDKFGAIGDVLHPAFFFSLMKLETLWVFGGLAVAVFILGLWVSVSQPRCSFLLSGVVPILMYYMIVARYAQEIWGIQYHIFALPFAALGVGIGTDWLLSRRQWIQRGTLLTLLGVALLLGSGYMYARLLGEAENSFGRHLLRCGECVKSVVPETERILVSTTSATTMNGLPNNYQEPTIFFSAQRYGWSVPADSLSVATLERYRGAGVTYFVIYDQELLQSRPDLVQYLSSNADQVGPGIEAGCAVYRLRGRNQSGGQ